MTTDREAELICEVAERYGITTLEVVRMVRLVVYGPLGARMYEQCGIYEPGEDESRTLPLPGPPAANVQS
jgi:hypothetical protein